MILFLSTAGYPANRPLAFAAPLVSIASFLVGCFLTARISHALGPLRRYVLASHFLAQAILCLIPAALTLTGILPSDPEGTDPDIANNARTIGAIPPLALQSGAVMATSKLLGFAGEIPVNVLTSTYQNLATDPHLFALHNTPRNRRLGAFACIALGATSAAWIQRETARVDIVYWLAAAIKFVLAGVVWVCLGFADDEGQ